ncbi:MAG: hypothetical protein ACK4PI_12405 [Tepidisphaerales bacterium]
MPNPLAQTDRQEDFLRALREAEGTPVDPQTLLLFLLSLALIVAVAYWLQQRSETRPSAAASPSPARPKRRVLRNARRLERDVARELGLSRADQRKLEHHARRLGVVHPMVLLLCPSLTKAAAATRPVESPRPADTSRPTDVSRPAGDAPSSATRPAATSHATP